MYIKFTFYVIRAICVVIFLQACYFSVCIFMYLHNSLTLITIIPTYLNDIYTVLLIQVRQNDPKNTFVTPYLLSTYVEYRLKYFMLPTQYHHTEPPTRFVSYP